MLEKEILLKNSGDEEKEVPLIYSSPVGRGDLTLLDENKKVIFSTDRVWDIDKRVTLRLKLPMKVTVLSRMSLKVYATPASSVVNLGEGDYLLNSDIEELRIYVGGKQSQLEVSYAA